jgi:anti-anti-sigma regulatory factor
MEDNESFQISLRKINDQVAILDTRGRIIGTAARKLEEHLLSLKEAGFSRIIVNFIDVESIDDVGIEAFASALKAGIRVLILHPNTNCKETLLQRQSRLTKPLEIFHKEEEALRASGEEWAVSQEKRKHERIEFQPPRSLQIQYQNNKLQGLLLNVSKGGALLGYVDALPSPMPKDLRISLKLRYLGMVEFSGEAVALRERSDMHTLAIKILHHNEKSRHIIQRICDDPDTTLPAQE